MNATPEPHGPVDRLPDEYAYETEDDGFAQTLPVRPKRPFLTKWSAGLMAIALGGVGFYVGVRVEKDKIPSSSGTGGASAFAKAFTGGTSKTGGKGGAGSFASRFGAGGAAALFGGTGSAATGSVSSVNGNTIYVKETSGNTVKVKLTADTTITKSETVGAGKVDPGDGVVIDGTKGSGGTVTASSLTDSGATSTGGSSNSSSTSGNSAASAVSSLFGGA